MAYLLLDVPLEAQTSSDTCWHASALMIWEYWQKTTGKQGPMNTLSQPWKLNQAIPDWEFPRLARKVGLKEVARSAQYTSDILETLLTNHGPIMCLGNWYGVGHAIVLTGIDGESVHLNDPDGGVKKTGLLAWFNTKLYNTWPECLMCKDPNAY